MADSPSIPLDLSTATEWFGFRPGMTRAEALREIEARDAEHSEDETDPGWMLVWGETWGLDLRFAPDGEQRLRQVAMDVEECHWKGRPFIGRPVHEALEVMGDDARGAGWRPEDAVSQPFEDLKPVGLGPFSDEELLEEGTLWIPRCSIGLTMCEGSVCEVAWRLPHDLPTQFAGPFTEPQRQISRRPDLEEYLRRRLSERRTAITGRVRKRWNWAQRALTILLIAALIYIGREGFLETQRWHAAPVLTGKLVGIDKATAKPWGDVYRIEYVDPEGKTQIAALEAREFYVVPREIGDSAQVHYVSGDPPRVKGPSFARDPAFLLFLPQVIGAVSIWMIAMFAAGFLPRREETVSTTPQPVRPDLPTPPGLSH